jgi:hypothetical protein
VVAFVLVAIPPLALLLIDLLELDRVPAVPFFVGATILEAVAGGLAIWGIVRSARGARLLWLAIAALVLAIAGVAFFALGVAFSIGYSQ